jgi:hypothetical protein
VEFARLRRVAAAIVAVGLLWPATATQGDIAWNLHVWGRLRAAGRSAPDSDFDAANRALIPYLPLEGAVGFSTASIAGRPAAEQQHLEQFLQYSLAPHIVDLTTDRDFVIEKGAAAAPASLSHNSAFALVIEINDDLRLFRRVAR